MATGDSALHVEGTDDGRIVGVWREGGRDVRRVVFPMTLVETDDLPEVRAGVQLRWSFERAGDDRLTLARPA